MTQATTNLKAVTTIRLSSEDHSALKQIAQAQQRSVSAQIRYWISQEREAA